MGGMRITGGQASGRILKVPKGLDVRPTPDLVKQAVFNSLGGRVAGASVLELFAGTGALSLEVPEAGARLTQCASRRRSVMRGRSGRFPGVGGHRGGQLEIRVQDVFHGAGATGSGGGLVRPGAGRSALWREERRAAVAFAGAKAPGRCKPAGVDQRRRRSGAGAYEAGHAGNTGAVARVENAQARGQRDADIERGGGE